jgi:predicted PurR-regulated permease PerM
MVITGASALVLGDTVKLHPLVVLIGVLTGGLMFGLVGLLLALPTITIFKTLISTAREGEAARKLDETRPRR